MRKVPLLLIAIGTVVATALPLASPAHATAAADVSHGGRVTTLPADAAGPRAAAAVSQTGIGWKSCGAQLQCAQVSVPLNWDQPDGTSSGTRA